MIRLENITYSYNGAKALNNISLKIKKGEKIMLMGVNGSGKSTLLKLIAGLIFAQQGKYYFEENLISKNKIKEKAFNTYFRMRIAMLFQKPDVMLFNPTVYDELSFCPRQIGSENIDADVNYWAERLNIAHLLSKQPFNLSCGEKKKVALASLLIINPEILILDEPFSYLDPQSTEWMVNFLSQLDKTLIVSMHNLKLASMLSNHLMVLSSLHQLIYNGKLETFSTSDEKLKSAGMFTNLKLF